MRAPGLSMFLPLPIGPLGEFVRDPFNYQQHLQATFGDVVRLQFGPLLVHTIYHPSHVREVLFDKAKVYQRGWQYDMLRRMMGENLVVSEGDYWRRQRRLAQPAFHHQRLTGYAETMVAETLKLVDHWHQLAARGEPVDVGPAMSKLALSIAGLTLFDRDVSQSADVVGQSFTEVAAYLEQRLNHPMTTLPPWVPTPMTLRYRRALSRLNRIVLDIIGERRKEGGDRGDLLSMLMQIRDEDTGESMTDDQLRSEVLAFFIAGHETTATALTWILHLLAGHPEIRGKVRSEVHTVLGGRRAAFADAPGLARTRMVIEESLRLYPPVWATPRVAQEDDEIGGFRIPRKSTILLCNYITHRHPEAWTDPEVFDPQRFHPERKAAIPRGAYFPFLAGPHQCIGQEFALLEMRLILATLLQTFDLEPVPGPEIKPVGSITLKPSAPVRVRLGGA